MTRSNLSSRIPITPKASAGSKKNIASPSSPASGIGRSFHRTAHDTDSESPIPAPARVELCAPVCNCMRTKQVGDAEQHPVTKPKRNWQRAFGTSTSPHHLNNNSNSGGNNLWQLCPNTPSDTALAANLTATFSATEAQSTKRKTCVLPEQTPELVPLPTTSAEPTLVAQLALAAAVASTTPTAEPANM